VRVIARAVDQGVDVNLSYSAWKADASAAHDLELVMGVPDIAKWLGIRTKTAR